MRLPWLNPLPGRVWRTQTRVCYVLTPKNIFSIPPCMSQQWGMERYKGVSDYRFSRPNLCDRL